MTKKILIYTSKYIVNRGFATILKDLDTKIEFLIINSKHQFDNVATQDFNYLVADADTINSLKDFSLFNNLKIIILDDNKHSFSSNMNIIKIISVKSNKSEILSILKNIFEDKTENEHINEEISEREREIIKFVALGYTNKQIADKLFLSIHTITTHRKNISNKLGIKTISGLTIYAILNGIINLDDKKS